MGRHIFQDEVDAINQGGTNRCISRDQKLMDVHATLT